MMHNREKLGGVSLPRLKTVATEHARKDESSTQELGKERFESLSKDERLADERSLVLGENGQEDELDQNRQSD